MKRVFLTLNRSLCHSLVFVVEDVDFKSSWSDDFVIDVWRKSFGRRDPGVELSEPVLQRVHLHKPQTRFRQSS